MVSSLDCSEMVESRIVFGVLSVAQLLLLLPEVDSCTKIQDTTEDVRSHVSLGTANEQHSTATIFQISKNRR